MARQRNVWLGMLAIAGALIVGACADSAPSPVPPPLIGERSEAGMGSLSQPIVIMLVTPTPSAGESSSESAGSSQGGEAASGEAADSASAESADEAAGQTELSDEALINSGEAVYANNCATCHGPDGQGGGSFPALAGSALVTSEGFSGALTTVLHGRGQMPAFADQLADEEVAAVLSYIRNAWDHDASVVQVSDVSQTQEGEPAGDTGDDAAGDQAQADQADPDQAESEGEAAEASAAPEESAQPDESQASTGQTGDQQQASTTVSTEQGTITIQLQVVILTPEPQAGTGASGAEEEAAPPPSEDDANGDEAAPLDDSEAEDAAAPPPTEDDVNGDEAAPLDDSEAEDEAAPPPSEAATGGQAIAVIQIIITIDDAGNVAVQQSSGTE